MVKENETSLEELIVEETTKRLDEMASPDYEFPKRITRWDVVWMVVGVAVSAILIALCMTGVIS